MSHSLRTRRQVAGTYPHGLPAQTGGTPTGDGGLPRLPCPQRLHTNTLSSPAWAWEQHSPNWVDTKKKPWQHVDEPCKHHDGAHGNPSHSPIRMHASTQEGAGSLHLSPSPTTSALLGPEAHVSAIAAATPTPKPTLPYVSCSPALSTQPPATDACHNPAPLPPPLASITTTPTTAIP